MPGKRRPLSWWYWYATSLLLSAWALGWDAGAPVALALAGWQIVHYSWRLDSLSARPVQVRIAHFSMLVLGAFWPVLLWAQCAVSWWMVLFADVAAPKVRWRAA